MARQGSRLTRLDAFAKTVEDARVRTTTGGVVTIVSVLVILFLVVSEWRDYARVIVRPELVVDKTRGMSAVPRPTNPQTLVRGVARFKIELEL